MVPPGKTNDLFESKTLSAKLIRMTSEEVEGTTLVVQEQRTREVIDQKRRGLGLCEVLP